MKRHHKYVSKLRLTKHTHKHKAHTQIYENNNLKTLCIVPVVTALYWQCCLSRLHSLADSFIILTAHTTNCTPLGDIPTSVSQVKRINPGIDRSEFSYRVEMALIPCHHHFLGFNNNKSVWMCILWVSPGNVSSSVCVCVSVFKYTPLFTITIFWGVQFHS